jgi:hypothetical protein
MPLKFEKTFTGEADYGNPFVGPVDHTAPIDVDLSTLSDDEIDAKGYLKPGIPLTSAAALAAAQTRSVPGSPTPGGGNTGNGTVGAATGGFGAPAETITITFTTTGATAAFRVEGSVSGLIGTGAVGTPFDSPVISLTISDGSADWTIGDTLVYEVTAGVSNRLFGVTLEPRKVAADNADATIAALGVETIIVATIGQVNRDILEDNLGRSLTAAEVAAFADSTLVLI